VHTKCKYMVMMGCIIVVGCIIIGARCYGALCVETKMSVTLCKLFDI